jgi:hypothetical protein
MKSLPLEQHPGHALQVPEDAFDKSLLAHAIFHRYCYPSSHKYKLGEAEREGFKYGMLEVRYKLSEGDWRGGYLRGMMQKTKRLSNDGFHDDKEVDAGTTDVWFFITKTSRQTLAIGKEMTLPEQVGGSDEASASSNRG